MLNSIETGVGDTLLQWCRNKLLTRKEPYFSIITSISSFNYSFFGEDSGDIVFSSSVVSWNRHLLLTLAGERAQQVTFVTVNQTEITWRVIHYACCCGFFFLFHGRVNGPSTRPRTHMCSHSVCLHAQLSRITAIVRLGYSIGQL